MASGRPAKAAAPDTAAGTPPALPRARSGSPQRGARPGGSSPPPGAAGQTLLTALVSYSTSFCTELIMGAAAAGMAAAQGSGLAPTLRHGGGSGGCPTAAEGEAELLPERRDTTGRGTDSTGLLPGRGEAGSASTPPRRRLHGRVRASACAAA